MNAKFGTGSAKKIYHALLMFYPLSRAEAWSSKVLPMICFTGNWSILEHPARHDWLWQFAACDSDAMLMT